MKIRKNPGIEPIYAKSRTLYLNTIRRKFQSHDAEFYIYGTLRYDIILVEMIQGYHLVISLFRKEIHTIFRTDPRQIFKDNRGRQTTIVKQRSYKRCKIITNDSSPFGRFKILFRMFASVLFLSKYCVNLS